MEVSSLQGVGIEGFHCIQRCPHALKGVGIEVYRGVLTPGVGIEGSTVYRGVLTSLKGVGIEGFHGIQRCPHSRGLE